MSQPATPLQRSPTHTSSTSDPTEETFSSRKAKYASPKVVFQSSPVGEPKKSSRPTPSSGRGKLKRLKARIDSRLGELDRRAMSPSRVLSRSMLSFDLESRGFLGNNPVVVGEQDSLFVKFANDRRLSTGRGTLQNMIRRRIALQTGQETMALRQASSAVAPSKGSDVAAAPKAPPVAARARRRRARVVPRKSPSHLPSQSTVSVRNSVAEIPMGQEVLEEEDIVSPSPPEESLSQTQVFLRTEGEDGEGAMSQTQVFVRAVEESPLPFLGTPVAPSNKLTGESDDQHNDALETVIEEDSVTDSDSASSGSRGERIRGPVGRRRVQFIDDEAEMSEDGDHEGSEDDEDGFLSDLIASSTEGENEDSSKHASLHQRWLLEQENQEPQQPRQSGLAAQSKNARERKLELQKRAILQERSVAMQAKVGKPLVVKKKQPLEKTKEVVQPVLPPMQPRTMTFRPKKNPNRKSSVSSSTDIDVQITNRVMGNAARRSSRQFGFLSAPPEEALAAVQRKDAARAQAESKAAAGSRLLGSKRFVFG